FEQADRRARREVCLPGRRLLLDRHDPQQGRLAGAVRPEHADLGARQERQGDVRQDLAVRAVELVDPVHREDVLAAHAEQSNTALTDPLRQSRTVRVMKKILLLACALGLLALPASAARLPVLASHDWWPVFSPNGNWVAFTSVNGQGRVFTLEVAETATHRVTKLAQARGQLLPSWSPDSTKLAQARGQLLPSWSPDSTKLAYQSGGRVWTIGVDGTGRREVHAGGAPAWSSTGTISYVLGGTLRAG